MKKFLFLAIAAAAMTSCSQDEVLEVAQKQAISFGNAFVGNSTRAAVTAIDPSYSPSNSLTAFNVWGTVASGDTPVAIFTQTQVTGTVGTESVWNPATTQYWVEDAKYNFAALVNEGDASNVTLGNDLLPSSVKFTYSTGNVDLLYAKSNADIVGLKTANPLVQMEFAHLLSKVKFTVVNKSIEAEKYSFLVKNIKVLNATEATCALPEKTWNSHNTASDIAFSEIILDNATAKSECANELLLIPNDVTVSFTVDILYDSKTVTTHTYTTSKAQTLAVGHAYNFLIEVSVGEPIQFTVATNPTWTNGNTVDSDDADTDFDHIPVTSLN